MAIDYEKLLNLCEKYEDVLRKIAGCKCQVEKATGIVCRRSGHLCVVCLAREVLTPDLGGSASIDSVDPIPKSYHLPKSDYLPDLPGGCYDCSHVFEYIRDYRVNPIYFCHFDKSKRPRSGSPCSGDEYFTDDEPEKQYAAWKKWSEPRAVRADGICDKYQKK